MPPASVVAGTALALRASGTDAPLPPPCHHAERALWGSGAVDAAALPVGGLLVSPSPLQGGLRVLTAQGSCRPKHPECVTASIST
jgi:hypothetical protein